MEDLQPTNKFTTFQKILLGISAAFYGIYKYGLTDEGIKKALGVSYPWVLMICTIIMLFTGGLSGWQLMNYISDLSKLLRKKDD